jgi:hypothetical protein
MSNRVYIEVCKVESLYDHHISYNIRMNDTYNDGFFEIEAPIDDDLEVLRTCKDIGSDMSKNVSDIIDSILEYQKGVAINGTYYDWEEIKKVFE